MCLKYFVCKYILRPWLQIKWSKMTKQQYICEHKSHLSVFLKSVPLIQNIEIIRAAKAVIPLLMNTDYLAE